MELVVAVLVGALLGAVCTRLLLRQQVAAAADSARRAEAAALRAEAAAAGTAAPAPAPAPVPARARAVEPAVALRKEEESLARVALAPRPEDAVRPATGQDAGDRHLLTGSHRGQRAAVQEFALEMPEPGAPAVADIVVRGEGRTELHGMLRTATKVRTLDQLAYLWDGSLHTQVLLPAETTHVKVETEQGDSEWSVRLIGPAEVPELTAEREGSGSRVLAVRPGRPLVVAVHTDGRDSWSVRFVCGCWSGYDCECALQAGTPWVPDEIYGSGEGIEELTVPRPGLLVLEFEPEARWRVVPQGGA